jgi:hypothetical protein
VRAAGIGHQKADLDCKLPQQSSGATGDQASEWPQISGMPVGSFLRASEPLEDLSEPATASPSPITRSVRSAQSGSRGRAAACSGDVPGRRSDPRQETWNWAKDSEPRLVPVTTLVTSARHPMNPVPDGEQTRARSYGAEIIGEAKAPQLAADGHRPDDGEHCEQARAKNEGEHLSNNGESLSDAVQIVTTSIGSSGTRPYEHLDYAQQQAQLARSSTSRTSADMRA